jgi:delta 1-pyrroline-5-carboxylate dehydrogenase
MVAETVLLRLITEQGRPAVKISTSEKTSGMTLTGPTGTSRTYVQALAGSSASAVVLKNEDGGERRIEP